MRYLLVVLFILGTLVSCGDKGKGSDGNDTDTSSDGGSDTDSDTDVDTGGSSDTACIPSCAGLMCGDDGCGGACGTCPLGAPCESGVCQNDCVAGCTVDCLQGCFDMGACSSAQTLTTHANIETVGVTILQNIEATSSDLYYQKTGETFWWKGHPMALLPDDTMAGSLFSLQPDSEYSIMFGVNAACGTVRTLPVDPVHETISTFFVRSDAASGGDGTEAKPFATIGEAVAVAVAGTDIFVAPGIYHEEVTVHSSGAPGQYIRILGEDGSIIDGTAAAAGALEWSTVQANVFSTPWALEPSYLARDNGRFYHFTSLDGLRNGIGDDDIPFDEGWYVEGGLLYVRSLDDPAGHSWQLSDLAAGIALDGADWIWIEGLTIRYTGDTAYPKGIDVRDANNVVIRGNHIHDTSSPVWVRRGSSNVRVESNEIHQSVVHTWPWAAVKGTDHENSAITLEGGEGAIVHGNLIYHIFNGVYSGSFDDDQNRDIAFDVDVYRNRLRQVTDDGLEPEGACINNRFWQNMVDTVHNGVSLAPITFGPVWVIGNRFTEYDESGFKVSNDSSGKVLVYHNTCYTDLPEQNGMNVSGYFENMTFRNNIIRGTQYALEMSQVVGQNDFDFGNYYSPRGAPLVKWNDVRYDTVADWCSATGLECNGHGEPPGLVGDGAYSLLTTSPNIDAAMRIYGINDSYAGDSPDIGFLEFGKTEVPPLVP